MDALTSPAIQTAVGFLRVVIENTEGIKLPGVACASKAPVNARLQAGVFGGEPKWSEGILRGLILSENTGLLLVAALQG